MWTVAYDDVVSEAFRTRVGDAMEVTRKSWLQKPYQETGNIPGLLPLVRDLPVRFTDNPDREAREMDVFKNARGWLRGWDLHADETVPDHNEGEIVLTRRPKNLHIEMVVQQE